MSQELFPYIQPRRSFSVAVYDQEGHFLIGNIVSHLDLADWCRMKGYTLIRFYEERKAFPQERTDLF